MTRSQKEEVVSYLTEEFKNAAAIVDCDYKGMSVAELESLRRAAKEKGLKVRVVKNTLAMIALKNNGVEDFVLKETNVLVWGDDLVDLAKTVTDFAKEHKENFKIKQGYFEGEVADASKIEAYSKLPSKEELLGMLLSVWTAPLRNLLYVWNAPKQNFVTVLENIRQQKES
ncbi:MULTISPECIES: 50S ribosomal protein L10 [Nitratiruptor]|uniref:Large ribosomal subunit protein uL10 n=1 Tax=Nitratiruptor tergarcus DSM 16512 TaxID=1069081 RepID=A0A1W1WRN7_9BACT|nr:MULTISPECIES: 50S ribosomal protein L10 [Nitratiruptor]BCD61455.1 large subunit ribosomal protein L10 [Nitratiruptor sp. YY08-13]BCD65389.1 large subunit ribosomal protein L10 [Nitratiruptor sp. YY08-26]SMC08947.1 large subunit ribosomal protein L10 [Nitratiruptor tergarcus DSM 16512]